MDPNASGHKYKRIHLFSHQRTCSNLFMRMLDNHPSIEPLRYPMLLPLWFGPDSVKGSYLSPKIAQYARQLAPLLEGRTAQAVTDDLQRRIKAVEMEGRYALIKDHVVRLTRPEVIAGVPDSEPVIKIVDRRLDMGTTPVSPSEPDTYNNPTIYPDRFLRTLAPVFTIRHPVHMVPSYLRSFKLVYDEPGFDVPQAFALVSTYKWTRKLFDWFKSNSGYVPIVIDSEDLIDDPEGMMKCFCLRTGIDVQGVQYTWPAETTTHFFEPLPWVHPEGFGPISEVFFGTLDLSTGVKRPSSKGTMTLEDLEAEMGAWDKEFGKGDAQRMVHAIKNAMEDYNYLWENRLRP